MIRGQSRASRRPAPASWSTMTSTRSGCPPGRATGCPRWPIVLTGHFLDTGQSDGDWCVIIAGPHLSSLHQQHIQSRGQKAARSWGRKGVNFEKFSQHLESFTGGDKLRDTQGSEIQPGHAHLPPVAGQQAGVWPQLLQQGRRRRFRHRHAEILRGETRTVSLSPGMSCSPRVAVTLTHSSGLNINLNNTN